MQTPKQKYRTAIYNAKVRGVLFKLTFAQWFYIWQKSGHWEERGFRKGQYVMARKGDKGPYAVGNVDIVTVTENNSSKVYSVTTRAKIGAVHVGKKYWLGRKRTEATKAKISLTNTGLRTGFKHSKKTREKMRRSHLKRNRLIAKEHHASKRLAG